MPFKSEKQRKWMHANEPEMAKDWEKKKKTELVPNMAVVNPKAQATMQKRALDRAKDREFKRGVKLKTALNNKDHDDHDKAKSLWQKIKDRIMKNRKEYAIELLKRVQEQRKGNQREYAMELVKRVKEQRKAAKVNEDVLNEATYVKGKMLVILKNSFNQVHSSLVKNVSLSNSMDDNQQSRLTMFKRRMDAARDDYVKAVMRASKPFDKEITGV